MTSLEVVFLIIIWVIVGCFISYKRKWYPEQELIIEDRRVFFILANIVFAPLCLAIALFKEFILDDWNNPK